MEVGNLLVELRDHQSTSGLGCRLDGGYHRLVCVETVVGPHGGGDTIKPEEWPASGQCSVTIVVQHLQIPSMCHSPEETTVGEALSGLTHYYRTNSLQMNPDKTKVTAFHLRNKEAKRLLKIKWNNSDLEYTAYPKYLSVTQDRTLSYKETYRKQI